MRDPQPLFFVRAMLGRGHADDVGAGVAQLFRVGAMDLEAFLSGCDTVEFS